jgi:hypothetical protein
MRSRFGSVRMTELTDELPVTKETRLLALARDGLPGALKPGFCEPGRRPRSLALRAGPVGLRPGQSLPILTGCGDRITDPRRLPASASGYGATNEVLLLRVILAACRRETQGNWRFASLA